MEGRSSDFAGSTALDQKQRISGAPPFFFPPKSELPLTGPHCKLGQPSLPGGSAPLLARLGRAWGEDARNGNGEQTPTCDSRSVRRATSVDIPHARPIIQYIIL